MNFTSEGPDALQVQVFTKVGVTCFPSETATPAAAPTWAGESTMHASVSACAAEGIAAAHNSNEATHGVARARVLISGTLLWQVETGEVGVLPYDAQVRTDAWLARVRVSGSPAAAGVGARKRARRIV
ncbi:MAG: hypothetical protein ACTHJO_06065 [Rhodanobacter sp.]